MRQFRGKLPAPPGLAGLNSEVIGREALAGLTLLAIAVPLNIGYAQIAGLPASAGLYALILPTLIYALTASSRQVVASPDAAAAALVASSVGGLAVAGDNYAALAAAQAIISGALFLVLSALKLGFVASFLSAPILVGFVGGLALDILVSQIAKMLGVRVDSGADVGERILQIGSGLATTNLPSVLIAGTAISVLLVGRRMSPHTPWALVVLIGATVVSSLAGLEKRGVAVLGPVPAGPPSFSWPSIEATAWIALIPSALALTLITTAEGLLLSRAYGEKNGYRVESNRDLTAFGLANLAAGLQGSFAVGSSTSRTAAMDQSGSRTQLPSLILACGTILLLLFGTGLLATIPSPAIGAIIAVAIVPLLGIRKLTLIYQQDRFEFVVGAVCFVTTLLAGAINGLILAFVLSLLNIATRAAAPPIDVLRGRRDPNKSLLDAETQGPTADGVVLIRMAAPMFFANIAALRDTVKLNVEDPHTRLRHVVLDMEAVTDADVTAAEIMESLREWLRERDISMSFSRVRPAMLTRLTRLGIVKTERVYRTNRAAVADLARS